MRRDRLRRRDAVFPLLLHLGVHDQQRVVRQVDRNLTGHVGGGGGGGISSRVVVVFRHDLAHAKFPFHAETQTAYHGSRAQIRELVGVVAYVLRATVVAVDERRVGLPRLRGLIFQFLAFGVEILDARGDFEVDGISDESADLPHDGEDLSDVAQIVTVVVVLGALAGKVGQGVDVEAGCVWGFDDLVKDLEGDGFVAGYFG